jgi:hypothetical protein
VIRLLLSLEVIYNELSFCSGADQVAEVEARQSARYVRAAAYSLGPVVLCMDRHIVSLIYHSVLLRYCESAWQMTSHTCLAEHNYEPAQLSVTNPE